MQVRSSLFSLLAFVALPTFAAETVVDVDTVPELLDALWANNGNKTCTIRLASGDYELPDAAMSTNANFGLATLKVDKLKLVGQGASRDATRLIGAGNLRVIQLENSGWVENLTVTNGSAATKYGSLSNSTRGGCVVGSGTLTNCVVSGGRGATHGGGVAEGVKLYDCRIRGNSASWGGGTFHVWAYDTLIDGNTATEDGGGGYADYAYEGCVVSNNTAKVGGGAVKLTRATSTTFVSNRATADGGGVAGSSNAADDAASCNFYTCTFTNNFSGRFGGAAYHGTLHDCTVVGNFAQSGGGLYQCAAEDSLIRFNTAYRGNAGGAYGDAALTVVRSVFFGNTASNDTATVVGGVIYKGCFERCEIYGNACFNTPRASDPTKVYTACGLVASATLVGCDIHHNYIDYYGALRESKAVGCILRDNFSGDHSDNAYKSDLVSCDVSGTATFLGSAMSCTFHDIGGTGALEPGENPFFPDGLANTCIAVFRHHGSITNSLIRNCGSKTSSVSLMIGHNTEQLAGALVNCTVVSNNFSSTFNTFKAVGDFIDVRNSVFCDNWNTAGTVANDILFNNVEEGSLRFSRCVYGQTTQDLSAYCTDGTLWQFGVGDFVLGPRFAFGRNPAHPYEPRKSSPLLGKGETMDWMVGADDVRGAGFPRLDEGKVGLGCYQCHLPDIGLILQIR